MTGQDPSSPVLLVGGDLNAAARVQAAADAASRPLARTDAKGLADALGAERPALVLVDLDMGGAPALEALASASSEGVRVVAFFSHVDEGAGRRAREAGLEALPRGRFWRELPGIVARLGAHEV